MVFGFELEGSRCGVNVHVFVGELTNSTVRRWRRGGFFLKICLDGGCYCAYVRPPFSFFLNGLVDCRWRHNGRVSYLVGCGTAGVIPAASSSGSCFRSHFASLKSHGSLARRARLFWSGADVQFPYLLLILWLSALSSFCKQALWTGLHSINSHVACVELLLVALNLLCLQMCCNITENTVCMTTWQKICHARIMSGLQWFSHISSFNNKSAA